MEFNKDLVKHIFLLLFLAVMIYMFVMLDASVRWLSLFYILFICFFVFFYTDFPKKDNNLTRKKIL